MLRYKLRFNCFFKRSTVHRFLLWVLNKDFFIIIYLFYFFRSIISTLDHYGGPLWVIKTLATPGKCPEFGAHMQSHCGYATAVLVTGPLPCRPVTSGRDRAALFFKALNAVLDGHPPCQGLRPVARVSHPRVGMPHRPKDTFSRSLWTSLQGVLCYAQQWPAQRRTPSSGSACHPSEPYFQPTAAVLSWWVLQCLTCCLCAEVRMRMTLRGPGGETEQGRDNNCLEHLQLSAYCDDSLCPYSCPQPANGSTCYSQSVWHFFVPELGWPHCASEEQILLQAAATPLLSAGLRSKALILAAVQWQVCFIQGCTAVMEGDASICGGEWRKQRGSEREGEKSWNQNTALFDATGYREGIRHKSFFFHYASHHSNKERPDDVDKSRWTAKLEQLWPTDPHDWLYQRPWSGAQRGCTGSDSARLLFLDLYFLRRRLCRLSLCFSWSRHADSRRRHHPTSSCDMVRYDVM